MSHLYKINCKSSVLNRFMVLVLLGMLSFSTSVAGVPVDVPPSDDLRESDSPAVQLKAFTQPVLTMSSIFFAPSFSENAPGQGSNPFPFSLDETFGTPTLADLDNDGDLDMLSGDEAGNIAYFQNAGSPSAPNFQQLTDASNPFDGVNIADGKTAPALVDINGDGAYDVFVGSELGGFAYYENTGDASNPAFTAMTGADNPLDGADIGNRSAPDFADLDGDGDYDMVSGGFAGTILYFQNTGSSTSPTLSQQSGAGNPFAAISIGSLSKPALGDIDADGDYDLVIGNPDGTLLYYENTGSPTAPTFEERTGMDNPLDGFDSGTESSPAIADITSGNGVDVVVGNNAGDYYYYLNADPLPVELSSFEAVLNGDDVVLTWSTASETNNAGFEVQQRVSGSYQSVGWVQGMGTTTEAQNYSYTVSDVSHGTQIFRLKQVDFDGAFEFSGERSVTYELDESFVMSAVYPNPMNPQATFSLTVARDQQVTVAVYDIQGKMVSLLHSGSLGAQSAHQFTIDGTSLASGKYMIRAVGEVFQTSQVITLLK